MEMRVNMLVTGTSKGWTIEQTASLHTIHLCEDEQLKQVITNMFKALCLLYSKNKLGVLSQMDRLQP